MNTSILTKCVEALNKENPDISYIKGMLETLIELAGEPKPSHNMIRDWPHQGHTVPVPYIPAEAVMVGASTEVPMVDESTPIQDAYTRGPVAHIS